jgi:hypothetical protein
MPTGDQLTDGLTKLLLGEKFRKFRDTIGLIDVLNKRGA